MEQVSGTFDFLYIVMYFMPIFGAVLFWGYYIYARYKYHSYGEMKRMKLWNDLPRSSAAESKEETLNMIIEVKKRQKALCLRLAVMFSVIAVFWLYYMR